MSPLTVITIGSAAFVVPGHAAGTTGHVGHVGEGHAGQLGHAAHSGLPEIRLTSVWNVLSPEEAAVRELDFIETI